MPNKTLYKTLKLAAFSGLFYASGLALFDYSDGVNFRFGKFIFDFLFFGCCMFWVIYENVVRSEKEN